MSYTENYDPIFKIGYWLSLMVLQLGIFGSYSHKGLTVVFCIG